MSNERERVLKELQQQRNKLQQQLAKSLKLSDRLDRWVAKLDVAKLKAETGPIKDGAGVDEFWDKMEKIMKKYDPDEMTDDELMDKMMQAGLIASQPEKQVLPEHDVPAAEQSPDNNEQSSDNEP